jgi:hypothetical protein
MKELSALSETVSSNDGWRFWFCDGGIQAINRDIKVLRQKISIQGGNRIKIT